jgi:hypothetical protein
MSSSVLPMILTSIAIFNAKLKNTNTNTNTNTNIKSKINSTELKFYNLLTQ